MINQEIIKAVLFLYFACVLQPITIMLVLRLELSIDKR